MEHLHYSTGHFYPQTGEPHLTGKERNNFVKLHNIFSLSLFIAGMVSSVNFDRPFAANNHMLQNPPYWNAKEYDSFQKKSDFGQSSLTFLCVGFPSAGITISLLSSMANFVPSDRLLQKAYSPFRP